MGLIKKVQKYGDAFIIRFNKDDREYLGIKTGDWFSCIKLENRSQEVLNQKPKVEYEGGLNTNPLQPIDSDVPKDEEEFLK